MTSRREWLAQVSLPLFQRGKTRVLILSGRNNHDWRTTTPCIRKLLVESGRFDVRVNEEPAGMTAETLAAYQVVLLDYNGPRWGATAEQALEGFVRRGGGLVVVHGASWAFSGLDVLGDKHVKTGILEPAWPEYARMVGGVWSMAEPKTGHGKRHKFAVKMDGGETLQADDELYHYMRMQPDVKIMATAFDDPAIGGTGKQEPVLWTVAYGKGRTFHTTLGHDVAAMEQPAFKETLLRGAAWAAGA